jgi:hypothetical protein
MKVNVLKKWATVFFYKENDAGPGKGGCRKLNIAS